MHVQKSIRSLMSTISKQKTKDLAFLDGAEELPHLGYSKSYRAAWHYEYSS